MIKECTLTRRGNVLVIPDLHTPFNHPDAIDWLRDVAAAVKPKTIVCIGDEIDAYNFSRYVRRPDMPNAAEEFERSLVQLRLLYKLFPRAYVCESNHTYRPYARAIEAGLTDAFLRSIKEVLGAPKHWHWNQHWKINDVLYFHGDGYSGLDAARKAAVKNRCSTVIGHVHSAQAVQWLHGREGAIFGMSVGCLIDADSLAFAYARNSADRPALGCGVLLEGMPVIYPFQ